LEAGRGKIFERLIAAVEPVRWVAMRWRIKVYRGPRIGDVRIHRHLAVFPAKIGFFRVWLEHYYSVEKCYHVYGSLGAKWMSESLFFDRASAGDYVKDHYEGFTYLKIRDLYRDITGLNARSPWYTDQAQS
jgi:hypothetical protein